MTGSNSISRRSRVITPLIDCVISSSAPIAWDRRIADQRGQSYLAMHRLREDADPFEGHPREDRSPVWPIGFLHSEQLA